MGKMIGRGMPNIFLFILHSEGQPLRRQKRFKFYLNNSHGFNVSNMIKSLQYFIRSIFYDLKWPDLKKIVLSLKIRNFKTHNNQRTMISRWFGREIVVAGLPPLVEGRRHAEPHDIISTRQYCSQNLANSRSQGIHGYWDLDNSNKKDL